MSYILEALKKAEQQREIGQVPRIDSAHEPAAAGLSSRWGVIVVLVLLVNAGLLLALFWPDRPANLQEAAKAPAVTRTGTESVDVQPMETPTVVQQPASTESLPVTPPITAPAPPQVRPSPAVSYSPPVPPAPVPQPEALPVWPQVPSHIFEQLHGNLRLDVHVYSEKPRDRFVLINLQKYHEGEQLQEGPVVDAITAEGVVLSLQGQQFLLRAQ